MTIKQRGRPRSRDNCWMPPGVSLRPSGYIYRRRSAGEYRKLTGPDASRAEVWAAYEAMNRDPDITVSVMIDSYFRSPTFIRLAASTQENYQQYAKRLHIAFGEMLPDNVTSVHVQAYVDKCGLERPTATNHERAFLSLLFNWGKARGFCTIANPVDAVSAVPTEPGGRYVSHEDYLAFHEFLLTRKHPMHAAAMEIAYLCGSRQQDVLRLMRARPATPAKSECYVVEEGLVIWQAKTGKVQLQEWNADLRAAVDLALSHHGKETSRYLLRSRGGVPFTRTGFNSTWLRRQRDAVETDIISARFRFHDLKIKALSDFEGNDLARFSGHKSKSQAERYNRTPDRVVSLSRPKSK